MRLQFVRHDGTTPAPSASRGGITVNAARPLTGHRSGGEAGAEELTPGQRPERARRRSQPGARAPRLADVARAAGVSTATVSRTFNDPEKVAPAIRDRVLACAASLVWLPHPAGRALASRRSYIAGAVIPTLDQEIFAAQVGAMQDVFAGRGMTLFLGCSNYDQAQALRHVRAMLARGVEALALAGETQPTEVFTIIAQRGVPYVITYAYRPDSPHPCIGFDNRAAFHAITQHLLALGHRIFGVIIQPTEGNDRVTARLAGLREALATEGLGIRPQHFQRGRGALPSVAKACVRF